MKRITGALLQGWLYLSSLLPPMLWVGQPLHNCLSEEEESCSSVTYSDSGDSNVDKDTSIKENAAHVYSELTTIRDKLHVRCTKR